MNKIKLIFIFVFIFFVNTLGYEITISRDEGRFVEKIEIEEYNSKPYIDIDDVVRIFKLIKYWHPVEQKIVLQYDKYNIEMFIDNPKIVIDKKLVDLIDSPKIFKDKIMLPLSFVNNNISEIVERKIIWNIEKKILTINKSEYNVTQTRIYAYPNKNYTRVAIDISKELKYEIDKQISTRLAINILEGLVDTEKCKQQLNDNVIKEIQSFQNKNNAVIYIDLKDKSLEYKSFLLTNPYRIVIDIYYDKSKEKKESAAELYSSTKKTSDLKTISKEESEEEEEEKQTAQKTSREEIKSKDISIIVLDPGHGGKDPGAIGPTGLKEKDVVLKIAKNLRNLLVKHLGVRVLLTREGDYFIPLEERTRSANFNKADLFVSIHTNASFKSRTNGFEVFYFAANMNIDPYSLAVVMKENSVINMEEGKRSKMNDIDIIVYDVLQTEYIKESKIFANLIQKNFINQINTKNRGIKQGPFFVLRNAQMPSVLVETGFISNIKDEENMRNEAYLNKISKALFDSIVNFKKSAKKH